MMRLLLFIKVKVIDGKLFELVILLIKLVKVIIDVGKIYL